MNENVTFARRYAKEITELTDWKTFQNLNWSDIQLIFQFQHGEKFYA